MLLPRLAETGTTQAVAAMACLQLHPACLLGRYHMRCAGFVMSSRQPGNPGRSARLFHGGKRTRHVTDVKLQAYQDKLQRLHLPAGGAPDVQWLAAPGSPVPPRFRAVRPTRMSGDEPMTRCALTWIE